MCSSYDLCQIFHAVPFHHGRQIFDNGLAGIRLHEVRRAHADGGRPVRMERTTAVDPQARRLYADASKLDHKWITVTPSDHYYAAPLPAGTRRVEVTARDRFGNTYRAEKRINR